MISDKIQMAMGTEAIATNTKLKPSNRLQKIIAANSTQNNLIEEDLLDVCFWTTPLSSSAVFAGIIPRLDTVSPTRVSISPNTNITLTRIHPPSATRDIPRNNRANLP